MPVIEWNEELSVGIESIDKQHQSLINYINKLGEAVEKGNADQVLGLILDGLANYTQAHFMYEEMLFDVYEYPQTDAHKTAHKKLFSKVDEFRQRYEAGDESIYPELLDFLKDWLFKHILKEDMAYSSFLKDQGVK